MTVDNTLVVPISDWLICREGNEVKDVNINDNI